MAHFQVQTVSFREGTCCFPSTAAMPPDPVQAAKTNNLKTYKEWTAAFSNWSPGSHNLFDNVNRQRRLRNPWNGSFPGLYVRCRDFIFPRWDDAPHPFSHLIRNSRMPIHLKGHFDQELLRLERLEVRHMKIVQRCSGIFPTRIQILHFFCGMHDFLHVRGYFLTCEICVRLFHKEVMPFDSLEGDVDV